MLLAVKKDEGSVPGGGYHYLLHPIELRCAKEAAVYRMMGYLIIDVEKEVGTKLLKEACAALRHQIEVAYITEDQARKQI